MPHSDAPLSPLAPLIATALREAGDEGLTLREIEVAVGTRWALRVIRAMCRAGYVIGSDMHERFVLVREPGSTGASDDGRPATPRAGRSSGAAVDPELRLFDMPSYRAEAA
jgi:hypothetical protein